MEHRPIPHTGRSSDIWRIEKSLQLVALEPVDQLLIGTLFRNRMNLSGQVDVARGSVFQKAEQGLDCRKPNIARSDRVLPFPLQGIKKVEDELRGKLLDLNDAGTHAEPFSSEEDKQFEADLIAFY